VVYVPDASRAVGVVTKLLSIDMRDAYVDEVAADYEKVRGQHANKKGVALVSLEAARANRPKLAYVTVKPRQAGVTVLNDIDLGAVAHYIDWGPFFQTWDLAGSYPKILDDALVGEAARNVFADGKAMLQQLVAEKWISANAVFGLFPAQAVGDDIAFYVDEARKTPLITPAPSRSRPALVSSRSWPSSKHNTTTTAPSCSSHWPTGWPKPRRSGCMNGCEKITGAMPTTSRSIAPP
jgi:5-methyltetrahydrofolate--homocysteine methyltransferase